MARKRQSLTFCGSVCLQNFVAQKNKVLFSPSLWTHRSHNSSGRSRPCTETRCNVVNGRLLKTADAFIFLPRTHLHICLRGQRAADLAAEIFNSHFSSRCQSAGHIPPSFCSLHHLLTINQHPSYTQWEQINFHDKRCVSTHLALPCYLMI